MIAFHPIRMSILIVILSMFPLSTTAFSDEKKPKEIDKLDKNRRSR